MGNVIPIGRGQPSKPREPKITTYIHCAMCMEEVPAGESMMDYALEEIGFTPQGIQVWCRRHNANIIHLDFEGQKFSPVAG